MSLVGTLHDRAIAGRRVERLAAALARRLPHAARVLDVGCGDGLLTVRMGQLRPDCTFEGVDVLVRPRAAIPVREFDGRTLPYADASVDAVLLVDVLHHTDDPLVLLREASRVARQSVLLKDHLRDGFLAGPTLRAMDHVGNARHGVRLPYNYWTAAQWRNGFAAAGLGVADWTTALDLYPPPLSWVFGRGLHVVAVLTPDRATLPAT